MTRFGRLSPREEDARPAHSEGGAIPTIEECQRLEPALRQDLEMLDYEVRCLVNQILAGVDRSGRDGVSFMRASTTVLLSVAAGLMEATAERTHEPVDVDAFKAIAEDAAEWAKGRKLRYFLAGEG